MNTAGLKRGVLIVMNPQTGEVLAMVSLPTYDNNLFSSGISTADYQKLLNDPDKPLLNHAIQDQFPPGSTYKLVDRHGRARGRKITPPDAGPDARLPDPRRDQVLRLEPRGLRRHHIYYGFAPLQRHVLLPGRRHARHRPAGATGPRSTASGRRPGSTCPARRRASCRPTPGSRTRSAQPIYPGETYQAGIGQGYDIVTPIQLINAYAALANGGKLYQPQIVREIVGPDGKVVQAFKPELIRKLRVAGRASHGHARGRAQRRSCVRHTYNLVDLPIVIAGKSGTAEFGVRDSRAACRSTRGSSGSCPKDPAKHERPDFRRQRRLALVVLAFAYDSRTGATPPPRSSSTSCSSTTDQEGLPSAGPAPPRQLLWRLRATVARHRGAETGARDPADWARHVRSGAVVGRLRPPAGDLRRLLVVHRPPDGVHATAGRALARRPAPTSPAA